MCMYVWRIGSLPYREEYIEVVFSSPPVSAAAIAVVVVVVYRPTIHRAPTFRSQIVTANGFAVARWLFRQKRRI